jgi:hypothetical protein
LNYISWGETTIGLIGPLTQGSGQHGRTTYQAAERARNAPKFPALPDLSLQEGTYPTFPGNSDLHLGEAAHYYSTLLGTLHYESESSPITPSTSTLFNALTITTPAHTDITPPPRRFYHPPISVI